MILYIYIYIYIYIFKNINETNLVYMKFIRAINFWYVLRTRRDIFMK
ncbi:MAG: hypothetical protein N7Q72_01720 [Spiroplasma sp. Tabriz.8]|nr:hypothetical protein [Spiroplasma sp. Tabriz.8]